MFTATEMRMCESRLLTAAVPIGEHLSQLICVKHCFQFDKHEHLGTSETLGQETMDQDEAHLSDNLKHPGTAQPSFLNLQRAIPFWLLDVFQQR